MGRRLARWAQLQGASLTPGIPGSGEYHLIDGASVAEPHRDPVAQPIPAS